MKQSELKTVVINKLVETKQVNIDGIMQNVRLARDEKSIYILVQTTAFLYFTRISGDSAYRMAKQIVKHLETYNI